MINIYTNKKKLKSNKEVIVDNESFFDINVDSLTEKEIEIIFPIDNLIHLEGNTIKTPYGTCSIYDISTGSKTVINVIRNPQLIFDVTECGSNALNVMFHEINNTPIEIILKHTDLSLDKGLKLKVNGKTVVETSRDFKVEFLNEDKEEYIDEFNH